MKGIEPYYSYLLQLLFVAGHGVFSVFTYGRDAHRQLARPAVPTIAAAAALPVVMLLVSSPVVAAVAGAGAWTLRQASARKMLAAAGLLASVSGLAWIPVAWSPPVASWTSVVVAGVGLELACRLWNTERPLAARAAHVGAIAWPAGVLAADGTTVFMPCVVAFLLQFVTEFWCRARRSVLYQASISSGLAKHRHHGVIDATTVTVTTTVGIGALIRWTSPHDPLTRFSDRLAMATGSPLEIGIVLAASAALFATLVATATLARVAFQALEISLGAAQVFAGASLWGAILGTLGALVILLPWLEWWSRLRAERPDEHAITTAQLLARRETSTERLYLRSLTTAVATWSVLVAAAGFSSV